MKAMLSDTFPEMFKRTKGCSFLTPKHVLTLLYFLYYSEPPGYWDDLQNRRQFLIGFAKKMGFDPNKADNWRNKQPQLRSNGVSVLF
mgnify:CR=1 FL=1